MSTVRHNFSSQAEPRLLAERRAIAQAEGRPCQAVLAQALRERLLYLQTQVTSR
jgi:hypothetical protein